MYIHTVLWPELYHFLQNASDHKNFGLLKLPNLHSVGLPTSYMLSPVEMPFHLDEPSASILHREFGVQTICSLFVVSGTYKDRSAN